MSKGRLEEVEFVAGYAARYQCPKFKAELVADKEWSTVETEWFALMSAFDRFRAALEGKELVRYCSAKRLVRLSNGPTNCGLPFPKFFALWN